MNGIFEITVLILCGILAGAVGAAVTNWTLLRFLRQLEYRVEDLEVRVIRETKIRAGAKGMEAKDQDKRLEQWAQEQVPAQPAVPNYVDWRKSKMVSKQ